MPAPPPLSLVAREKNWMEFALLLEAAMEAPARYGLPDAFAVRATVGRMRRQLPSSLVTALKAMEYLRERQPAVLEARDASIGCAQVRLLARLEAAAPEAAAAVEAEVLRGAMRMSDLRAYVVRAGAAPQGERHCESGRAPAARRPAVAFAAVGRPPAREAERRLPVPAAARPAAEAPRRRAVGPLVAPAAAF